MCAGHYVPTVMAMHGELTGIHYTCRAVPGEWHVGFYCRFNGISVQMFIETQMLQQFENIILCRKFLCLWF